MNKKIICLMLVFMCTFGISCTVHAEEEYDNEWNYTDEYTENEYDENNENEYYDEYYYNEEDYIVESSEEENTEYYYEEPTEENPVEETTEEISVTEEVSVTEEISVIEETSVIEESVSEMPSEVSEEKSLVTEVSRMESIIDEELEVSVNSEPRILNLAFTAEKEDKKVNKISGTALWGIVFVLTVFSIIFLPRTRGIEFIKDRYRFKKAKKITKRHIR